MIRKHFCRKAIVAVTATLAFLAMMVSPASASPGDVIAGSFRVEAQSGNTIEFTIPGSGGANCTNSLPDPTIDVDIIPGTPATAQVNSFSSQSRFEYQGDLFRLDLTLEPTLTNAGTYNDPDITGLQVGLEGTIYEVTADASNNCTPGAAPVCSGIFVQLALDGTSNGGPAPDAPGDQVTLTGNSNGSQLSEITISGVCTTQFSVFNRGAVTTPSPATPSNKLTFEFI